MEKLLLSKTQTGTNSSKGVPIAQHSNIPTFRQRRAFGTIIFIMCNKKEHNHHQRMCISNSN
jgi:hypothetical protein